MYIKISYKQKNKKFCQINYKNTLQKPHLSSSGQFDDTSIQHTFGENIP